MKLKKAKIIIKNHSEIKRSWSEALKGKVKHIQKDDEIIFGNSETVAKVFSKNRLEILKAIIQHAPNSIYELAKIIERDFSNVYQDVKLLSEIGLIELKDSGDSRNGLIPIAKFSGIELDLAA